MSEYLLVWIRNNLHLHERLMAWYLRRSGWVVFYLDERSRECNQGTCWMKLYQTEVTKEARAAIARAGGAE
jgi:hypothetical protein